MSLAIRLAPWLLALACMHSSVHALAREQPRHPQQKPSVWLVIDGSGSMSEPLVEGGDTSRWSALRAALLGEIGERQHDAQWGLALYDGPLDDGTPRAAIACPRVQVLEPQLDSLSSIEGAYPAEPLGGSTPTDRALAEVRARVPDRSTSPQLPQQIVVLATDGAPNDFCATAAPAGEVRAHVLDEVAQLRDKGALVYVISLAGADTELQAHLEQVAAAADTGKTPFVPRGVDELRMILEDILGPRATCHAARSASQE